MSAAMSLRRSPRQLLRELIDWARNLAYVREMVDQELPREMNIWPLKIAS
jgi:hypothetical protein